MELVFKRYDECCSQLNPKKCHLAQPRIRLLGHVISENGIEVDPEKIKALVTLPTPKDTKRLATFVHKVQYLSRFVSFFAASLSSSASNESGSFGMEK